MQILEEAPAKPVNWKWVFPVLAAWVKMHLLTEQLGGPALDSNLTPARGPETNSAFYREVEKHSIDAVENDQVIWFKRE